MIAATVVLSCIAALLFIYYCAQYKPKPRKANVVFETCSACGEELACEYHSDDKRRYLTCVGCGKDTTQMQPDELRETRLRQGKCALCGGDLEPCMAHYGHYTFTMFLRGQRCKQCHAWIFTEDGVQKELEQCVNNVVYRH